METNFAIEILQVMTKILTIRLQILSAEKSADESI